MYTSRTLPLACSLRSGKSVCNKTESKSSGLMSEILQAEIVAYSSPKEIFVNGSSYESARTLRDTEYNFIDTSGRRLDGPPVKAFGGSQLWKN